MDLTGRRFALVGGAGLIGSHTLERLLQHDVAEVLIYDNFIRGRRENLESTLGDSRVRVFEAGGDICQTDILMSALEGIDGVFLFAALWLLQCQEYPRAAFDVNIGGTFNVLEACSTLGVKRLVYSSSASVYGDAVTEPMTEDHPLNNATFYGATKIAGEAMARAMSHRYGLDYVGLRYFNVYGPRQDYRGAYIAVIMKMLDAIDRGAPIEIFGDGSQSYDFVYVGDCAQANICAMQAQVSDRFYNVCTGLPTSVRDLAHLILELTSGSVPIKNVPAPDFLVRNRLGAPERAKSDLGFEARTSLPDGLRSLIEWRTTHMSQIERSRPGQ